MVRTEERKTLAPIRREYCRVRRVLPARSAILRWAFDVKHRFSVNSKGELEDRNGNNLGRMTSITFELPADFFGVGTIGGIEEPSTTEGLPQEGGAGETNGPWVEMVWAHYVAVMRPRNKDLDPEARKIIRDALRVATVDECKRAIDGCAASPYHMGQNARQRKYNRLSQILKARRAGQFGAAQTTRERIDFFIDMADKAGLHPGLTSADPARVRQAKRSVMDAWEYPGNDDAVANGEEERAWLEQNGIKVLEDPSERNREGTPKPLFEVQA